MVKEKNNYVSEEKFDKLLNWTAQLAYYVAKVQGGVPPTDSVGAIVTPVSWMNEQKKKFLAEFED